MPVEIHHNSITLSDLQTIFQKQEPLSLHPETRKIIRDSREFLDKKIKSSVKPIYGINTGFGQLCREEINENDLDLLQINLVRSHACGVGLVIPERISRLMMFLKIKSFTTGHSAITESLMDNLLAFYNSGMAPVVFEQGSLGASGDLVPLAHMTLPVLGEGEAFVNGVRVSGVEALKKAGLSASVLKAKEGLAMLNGTQFMLAYGIDSLWRAHKLMDNTMAICALAIDAFDGRTDFLDADIHAIRPHAGQIRVAATLLRHLEGSQIAHREKNQVQDPYSLRCLPQVLGASWDALHYVTGILETELNSITDNPLVFKDGDKVISGGNFHGQPLALALDFLAIAMAEVANITERLLYKIISGERELPVFLTKNPGLESGFMIPQYSAAALVSQNKQLATPASVDSIVSSNGQEDHVSMGANAATQLLEVVENVEWVLAIELLNAAQALEFRRPAKSSRVIEKLMVAYREVVPFLKKDRILHNDMAASREFILKHSADDFVA